MDTSRMHPEDFLKFRNGAQSFISHIGEKSPMCQINIILDVTTKGIT
jgi:hypothetical protein